MAAALPPAPTPGACDEQRVALLCLFSSSLLSPPAAAALEPQVRALQHRSCGAVGRRPQSRCRRRARRSGAAPRRTARRARAPRMQEGRSPHHRPGWSGASDVRDSGHGSIAIAIALLLTMASLQGLAKAVAAAVAKARGHATAGRAGGPPAGGRHGHRGQATEGRLRVCTQTGASSRRV